MEQAYTAESPNFGAPRLATSSTLHKLSAVYQAQCCHLLQGRKRKRAPQRADPVEQAYTAESPNFGAPRLASPRAPALSSSPEPEEEIRFHEEDVVSPCLASRPARRVSGACSCLCESVCASCLLTPIVILREGHSLPRGRFS